MVKPAQAYLLRTPRKVLSLLPSSGGFSTAAFAGVDALEGSVDVVADTDAGALAGMVGAEASAMGGIVL